MKPVPTPSDARGADADLTARLRAGRDALVADASVRGRAFGGALADVVDGVLRDLLARDDGRAGSVAIVAVGSYARRELCPGSDVDVLLVLPEPRRFGRDRASVDAQRRLAERLWYPLWDAGFVTGHGARTVRDTLTLIDADLDALTAMLDVRLVAGDAALAEQLATQARARAAARRAPVFEQLAGATEMRRAKPGMVSEMLEPNLKDGAGGLRDLHALGWAAAMLDTSVAADGALAWLVGQGYVDPVDASRLHTANDLLLDLRVALHRVNGGRSDLLALQDQDAVADALGIGDADVLVRELAAASRAVAWVGRDVWQQLAPDRSRPKPPDGAVDDLVVARDGRVALRAGAVVDAHAVLRLASCAAQLDAPIASDALVRLRDAPPPEWTRRERDAFIALLRAGARAIPVFEALDHVDVLTRILPEWEHVRYLPQRNAYHRFTVDRHLLEAVAECAALLDQASRTAEADPPFDAVVARATRRRDVLLLGALLHDIGKGLPGDHAAIGADTARRVARRLHLDSEAVEVLPWLVRDHLLMADTATRRDLSDEDTVKRFCEVLAGDAERLRILYLLTVGDSLATGPAAWSQAKAALMRDLFVKAAAIVESDSAASLREARRAELATLIGDDAAADFLALMPPSYVLAFDAVVMRHHRELLERRGLQVDTTSDADGRLVVTVAAPDRTGLLATVAGALTCCGLTVQEAGLYTTSDGMVLDVFRADDTFGRVADSGGERVRDTLARAFAGGLDVEAGVEERRRHYDRRTGAAGPVEVLVDNDASERATVVEVHADDQVGLLYRLARAFSEQHLDVTVAKVATLGERVVDTFYVADADGEKLVDGAQLAALEERIRAAV